jgi:glycosyltransferase involved in cell wall biosynthesis
MRFSITHLSAGDREPAAAISPAINAPLQDLDAEIESLLRPFREQSAPIRSIVAVGCDRKLGITREDGAGVPPVGDWPEVALFRLTADEGSSPTTIAQELNRPAEYSSGGKHPCTLDNLAGKARELCSPAPGSDLLVLGAPTLNEILTPLTDEFSFRAVAALLPQTPDQLSDGNAWRLRRSLFDRGLICVGSVQFAGCKALCFLASDAVRAFNQLDVESRGHISMSVFLEGAGFANQLFRYACVKLYAVRHGLVAAFPAWQGNQLFGLADKSCDGLALPGLSYPGFADNDRELWDRDDPPINIDLVGYFQEIPECWRRHRPLLRRLFQLSPERVNAIEAWRQVVTDGGRRTLVAVHVRRGDYRNLQTAPYFRIAPHDWYLDWLRAIWPTLREPLLFVATDDPDAVLPLFWEFDMVSATFDATVQALPDYVRDFEILRRADYLAMCNSSFSRMAAILAASTQKCFLPSFETQSFVPYEPWIDPAFWARFADSKRGANSVDEPQEWPAVQANRKNTFGASTELATIFFDITDLLVYLLHQTTLSGIQRVECEILSNLLDISQPQPVRFIVLDKRGGLYTIETSGLLDVIEDIRSGAKSRDHIESQLRALLNSAVSCTVRSRDVFLTIGAFWNVTGMGVLLQSLKDFGAIIGVFIHDIIPVNAPEYFQVQAVRRHVKGVIEALTFADFVLTTSEYNKASLAERMVLWGLQPLPIHVVPLAHQLPPSAQSQPESSSVVAGIIQTDFVLCVGTLEARKNPAYLFNIWKMMLRSGRPNIPSLVFVGRKGWLVQDLMDQLKACNYLGGRILILHNVTDAELDVLYRYCMLTLFPSFVEGWGLPVGESLAHGKICICSNAGGIPEVGGQLLDYIDPYNARDGLQQLLRYLDDPELRHRRELEIAHNFKARTWRQAAEELLRSAQVLTRQARPLEDVAAIRLPPGRYMPISSDAPAMLTDEMDEMDGMDGRLSAELICVSGWRCPEISGARAARQVTMVRFRADAPVGAKLNLVMRLAAYHRNFRIRIRSGSGAETEVSLAAGSEKLAVLSCEVEPGKLVTAQLSVIGAMLVGDEPSDSSSWMLKGILYFDPKRVAAEQLSKLKAGHKPERPAPRPSPPPHSGLVNGPENAARRDRIQLCSAPMEESRRAPSFGAFLQTTDTYWLSDFAIERKAPILAGDADRRAFHSGCGNAALAPQVGSVNDCIKLIRRSNQFVSMSRFSEGSIFDRSGVWKAFGYLQGAPPAHTPWLSNRTDGLWVDQESLAGAPFYDGSYLIFYNGNLHNYYHWLVEGLLPLDVLSRALGLDSNLKIVLPKSMDINALLDHRESLRAIGFGERDIVETAANLIKVREAIWVDCDLVQSMPAPHLKDFQQRIAALYASVGIPRGRRLLVARKGPTRTIHNLEQVQAFLSRYDFETVYLEGMSMTDQILLFQSAEFIIGPHGAGLANLLFCEPGTRVIELMPVVEMRPFFWLISQKLDLVHGLQFCATLARQDFQSSISVDIDKLEALIRMVDSYG